MWGWLEKTFPKRALGDKAGHVSLDVTVVSPNTLSSSIAPTTSAATRFALLYERTSSESRNRASERFLIHFLSGWHGGPLLVRAPCGRTIAVELTGATLKAPVDSQDGTALGSTPESALEYGELATRAPANAGIVYVRELPIVHGQKLGLRAYVEPSHGASNYRAAEKAQFVARRDVVLIDSVSF